MKLLTNIHPKKQKAKSIKRIMLINGMNEYNIYFLDKNSIKDGKLIGNISKYYMEPNYLVRPCPMTPRHGFVETRPIGKDKIKTITETLKETLAEDPDGELVIMPMMGDTNSAVVSHNMITVGYGRDGVTNGKGNTLSIDVPIGLTVGSVLFEDIFYNLETYGIPKNHTYVVEMVMNDALTWSIVQVRGIDRKISKNSTTEYIPKDMVVKSTISIDVITSLRFEQLIRDKYWKENTLFVTKSIQSHNATHVLLAGLPITTLYHEVGKEIKKTKPIVNHTTTQMYHFASSLRGIISGDFTKLLSETTYKVEDSIIGLSTHLSKVCALWPLTTKPNIQLLALSMYAMLMYTITACIGESRHYYLRVTGGTKFGGPAHKIFFDERFCEETLSILLLNRNNILKLVPKSTNLPRLLTLMETSASLFKLKWTSGYGGSKWYTIANGCREFYTAICDFNSNPSLTEFNTMCSRYTTLSSLVHNGGRGALTKFSYNTNVINSLNNVLVYMLDCPLPEPSLSKTKLLPKSRSIRLPKKLRRINWIKFLPMGYNKEVLSTILTNSMYTFWVSLFTEVPKNKYNTPHGLLISGKLSKRYRIYHTASILGMKITPEGFEWGKIHHLEYFYTTTAEFVEEYKDDIHLPITIVPYSRLSTAKKHNLLSEEEKIYSSFSFGATGLNQSLLSTISTMLKQRKEK